MLTGCQLALENMEINAAYEDRLIGVFVTTEHLDLFDFESYLHDNIRGISGGNIIVSGNTQKYEGRLYAELHTKMVTSEVTGESFKREEYVFPDVYGIPYFAVTVTGDEIIESYITTMSDPAIVDGSMHIHASDDSGKTVLEGTIYVTPGGKERLYYFNPVYQSADDRVYTLAGGGISTHGVQSEGSVMSQTLEATTTVTENGETKTYGISVTLSINIMIPPEKIVLLEMDTDNNLISRVEYMPGSLPKSLLPNPETAYIIVETHKKCLSEGDIVARDIYSKDAESIKTFFARDDGLCVNHWTYIEWP